MKKFYACLLLVFIGMLGLHSNVFAQTRIYPDLSVSITSKVPDTDSISDYAIYFDYSSCGSVNCRYYRRHNLRIYRDGDADANIIYTDQEDTKLNTYHYELPAGPGSNHRYGLRYREYSHAVYSCDDYSWSGFKYENGAWAPYATPSRAIRDTLIKYGHYSVLIRAITAPIKSPKNLIPSNLSFFDRIVLNWSRGTNIPNESHFYRIYRGKTNSPSAAVLLDSVTGSVRTWTDSTTVPNDVFYYWVTTCTRSYPNQSNNTTFNESTRTTLNAVQGKAKTIVVQATDGTSANRVEVTWSDLSSYFTSVKIEASIPNSSLKRPLNQFNSTTCYDDFAIPGYNYTYYVTPLHAPRTFPAYTDQGYRQSNGVISGRVVSIQGAGVDSVRVCARCVSAIPPGALAIPAGGYCTLTDLNGYYRIPNIYYYNQADFHVVPYKKGRILVHRFDPDSLTTVTLNERTPTFSAPDIKDTSVFTVSGKVVYPAVSGSACGVPGVEILQNGQKWGKFTDPNGQWSYTIQNAGTYTFKPVFGLHQFQNAQGQPQTTLLVKDNVPNVNFTDKQVDSIKVKVQSGCGTSLGQYASVRVTSRDGCFNKTLNTDANGLLTFSNLPARKYDVQVVELYPPNQNYFAQIGNKPITVDLTKRDTAAIITQRDTISITPADTLFLPGTKVIVSITPADTVFTTVTDTTRQEVIPKADFIYHSPLLVTANFAEAGAEEVCNKKIVLMEQYKRYRVYFNVNEQLGNCPVTDGVMRIYDYVSDHSGVDSVPIHNGVAIYTINAGFPEIAINPDLPPHQKLLYVNIRTGFVDTAFRQYWIMVTGAKSQKASFVTKSPEFPMLVLHDPPGDSSFAFVNKGTSITNFFQHEVLTGGEAGAYADLTFGGAGVNFKAGGVVKITLTAGKDTIHRHGWETNVTFDETFSTSDSQDLIGHDGDVYIGASFNQEFALADELSFDRTTCTPKMRVIPAVNFTGFNTTFIYTENHIRNTLIPNYRKLYESTLDGRDIHQLDSAEQRQAVEYALQISNWEDILAQNDSNRGVKAKFEKNISFSAGAGYSNEFTSDSVRSSSGEYRQVVNLDFAAGAKIENDLGFWCETDFGAIAKFRYSNNVNSGGDTLFHRKVGYFLYDGDVGDFFSVDIKKDEAFGVPAFELKLGTTSCPYEPGSQPRDTASIKINPPEIKNVPVGGIGNFTAYLTNASQSRETRDYAVKVLTTTNPNGAVIKLGGTQINNSPAYYTLDFNKPASIVLTVERGPLHWVDQYDSIGIVMYPPCRLEPVTSDTAWINVSFLHNCSTAVLYKPEDGWVVNQASNNILPVTFTGYDWSDEQFVSITLQYMKEGTGTWSDAFTIPKDSLLRVYYDRNFNVSTLPDGTYRLRVKTYCLGGSTYSPEVKGYIDRTSINPFGYPTPSNGILYPGQEISVSFDKNISSDFTSATIKLLTDDSTAIPIIPQCYVNKIILMPQINLWEGTIFQGVRFYATVGGVKDASGNLQKYPVYWNFREYVAAQSGSPFTCGEPGFQVPDNMVVATDSGYCGAAVYYPVLPIEDCYIKAVTIQRTAGLASGYFFPIGVTTNTYVMTNDKGKTATCTFSVTVVDAEPPVITDLSLDFNPAWPPNHTLFPVTVNYTTADNCGIARQEIYVTSSEPGKNTGKGTTPVVIQVPDEHHILLQAERTGSGNGRNYTINVKCTDMAGNISIKQASIYIPHDKGKVKAIEITDLQVTAKINAQAGSEPFTAKVWPNPTKDNFSIEIMSSSNENVLVSLIDISGRLIFSQDITGMIPFSFGEDLKPGMYFIAIKQGNYFKNIKIIKQ